MDKTKKPETIPRKIGNCSPPHPNFSSTNQPKHNPGRPKGKSLTTLLRKYLEKKISFEDPETQKIIRGKVKDAVIWRLIMNATQGDNRAIQEILDRLEGKVPSTPLIDQSTHKHYTVEIKSDDTGKDKSPLSLETKNRMGSPTKI